MASSLVQYCAQAEAKSTAKFTKQKQQILPRSSTAEHDKNRFLYEKLPDTAQVLYGILENAEVLHQVLQQFGGQTLRIPARWPPHGQSKESHKHPLRQVLTPEQMQKIVRHFGGTELYIPQCKRYLCYMRNSTIVSAFSKATQSGVSSGQAVQVLARRYQLSDRRIWGILKSTVLESK